MGDAATIRQLQARVDSLQARLDEATEALRQAIELLSGQSSQALELAAVFRLTPTEADLVAALMARAMMSFEQLVLLLPGEPVLGRDRRGTIKVHMSKVRRKLANHAVPIRTHKGVGYSFDAETKAKVRALLDKRRAVTP